MLIRSPLPSLSSYRITYYMPEGKIMRQRGTTTQFINVEVPAGVRAVIYEGLDRGTKVHQSIRKLEGDAWCPVTASELQRIMNPEPEAAPEPEPEPEPEAAPEPEEPKSSKLSTKRWKQ